MSTRCLTIINRKSTCCEPCWPVIDCNPKHEDNCDCKKDKCKNICKGDPGDKGERGHKGDPGDKGERGHKGDKGEHGIKGDKGERGIKGERGNKGDKGDLGTVGDKGVKGDLGTAGVKGERGIKGDKGAIGAAGLKGDKGSKGDLGAAGSKGEKGDLGAAGSKGATGSKGDKGDLGSTGIKGEKGDLGSAGSKGEKGDLGSAGSKGDKGDQGIPGTSTPDLITYGSTAIQATSIGIVNLFIVQTASFLIPFGRTPDLSIPVINIATSTFPVGIPISLSTTLVPNIDAIDLYLPPVGTTPRIAQNPAVKVSFPVALNISLLPLSPTSVGITFVLGTISNTAVPASLLNLAFTPSTVRVTVPLGILAIGTPINIALGTILTAFNNTSATFPAGSRLAVAAFLSTDTGDALPLELLVTLSAVSGVTAQFNFELV